MIVTNLKAMQVLPSLYQIKHSDPGSIKAGMATNTYILTANNKALIIDAAFEYLLKPIKEVLGTTYTLVGFLYSHNHVVGNSNFLQGFKTEFDVPFFLHPLDAAAFGIQSAGLFENPINHPLLTDFNIEVKLFAGHTKGSVIIYQPENDGLIVAGDAAMGATDGQALQGIEHLIRVPTQMSYSDATIRQNWLNFNLPVAHFASYHGVAYYNKKEEMPHIMKLLTRKQPTMSLNG
jgi:glyoxylase-like metal-dependent hydrolase (beta-lactamase superfamily II)